MSSADVVNQWCMAILRPAVAASVAWLSLQMVWNGIRGRF